MVARTAKVKLGMKIIAVTNLKGGCAKTTTTINLAACLAELGKRVLVLDLDPQGNTSQWIGIENNYPKNMLGLLSSQENIASFIQKSSVSNVGLVYASQELSALEKILATEFATETTLKRRLKQINSRDWDYLLIDTPPTLGLLTVNALAAAHQLIVPVSTHVLSLAGVAQLLVFIEKIKEAFNPHLEILGFLASRVDLRTRHAAEVLESLRDHFGDKVFKTVIRENIKLAEAPSYKKPITTYDDKGGAAQDFRAFTLELIPRLK
jgi:chromosome partitioning protein